jgi:hypothetical protein
VFIFDVQSPLFPLQRAAAQSVLGLLRSEELPPMADAVLNAGVYAPALADLSWNTRPIMSEVLPVLHRALTETGLAYPSHQDAARCLLVWITHRLIHAPSPDFGLLWKVVEIDRTTHMLPHPNNWAGAQIDASRLVGLAWTIDDFDCDPPFDPETGASLNFDRDLAAIWPEVVQEARGYLARNNQ